MNGVEVPITEHVALVVHEGMTVQEMLASLLSRDPKHERDADV
jgi:glycerol-3-phosphate dehydrogenase